MAIIQQGQQSIEPVVDALSAHVGDPNWREVSLLAVGHLAIVQRRDEAAGNVLRKLLERRPGPPGEAVVLVGEALLDVGAKGVPGACRAEVLAALRTQMQDRAIPAALRLRAGILLADTFDRLSTGLGDLPSDLDAFVPIAAKDSVGYDFAIGKYPVTNAQFRRFFDAGGYNADKPWWTPEAVKDIEQYYSDWRDGPRYWDDDRFNHSTQPVVGVSWYEAVAYCAWLTGELRAKGEIGENEKVRLPKEAEWMRVACGPHPRPLSQSGRGEESHPRSERGEDVYPWGSGEFDPARANTKESDLRQTTTVQMYPEGASAEGVWDLAGNVWEWSADWNEDKYPWLKGGSWWQDGKAARASSRYWVDPGFGDNVGGLRCVVVPGSR